MLLLCDACCNCVCRLSAQQHSQLLANRWSDSPDVDCDYKLPLTTTSTDVTVVKTPFS